MLGICGSHRTGKTTLARTMAETSGLFFLESKVSDTFRRMRVDPRADLPFEDRLYVQYQILYDMERLYFEAPTSHFITDRTPIDVYSYLLADVQRTTLDPVQEGDLERFWAETCRIVNRHFELVMVIQPGIDLIEAEGKAPATTGYVEHVNAVIIGLVMGRSYADLETNIILMKREITDLRERSNVALTYAREYFPNHIFLRDSLPLM